MTAKENTELIILQEDVKHIKDDVQEIKENSVTLNTTMTKLTSKLFNDSDTGEDGLFETSRKYGIRLTKIENIRAISYGVVAFISGFIGYWFKIKQ